MKLIIIINLFLIVNSADLVSNISNASDSEFQRKFIKLSLENGELLKTISELRIENANLRLELLRTKENEKRLSEEHELAYWNCSGLATHVEDMSGRLTTLVDDVQQFKPLIKERVTAYAKKLGIVPNTTVEQAPHLECMPKSLYDDELFRVACSAEKSNGTWTVIQRRMDGKTNFYRPWEQYKTGFGTRTGEFFIGLENLHLLTTCANQQLHIEMIDGNNQKRYAEYDAFEVSGEQESYALKKVGAYSGDAGNSLEGHKSQRFSTYDRDNDTHKTLNCAYRFKGAWWYNTCHVSNLNGEYGNHKFGEGINWHSFRGHEHSLKFVEMKIRPRKN